MRKCILGTLCVMAISACAPEPHYQYYRSIDLTPKWYQQHYAKDQNGNLLVSTAAKGKLRKIALQKAQQKVHSEIRAKLQNKMEALHHAFQQDLSNLSQINSAVSLKEALNLLSVKKIEGGLTEQIYFAQEGDEFKCFILYRLPAKHARKMLKQVMLHQKSPYARYKGTKAYTRLKNNLQLPAAIN